MHFASSVFSLLLAITGLAAAIPQPDLDINISILESNHPDRDTELHVLQENVWYIKSAGDFDWLMSAPNTLIVVDFKAAWCGPCGVMSPLIAKHSVDFPQALFLSVDIDLLSDLPEVKTIRSVPTFRFYKNKALLTEFSGASPGKLQKTIQDNL